MNKLLKAVIAILGAISVVFSILIPIAVAILLINVGGLSANEWHSGILLVSGFLASLYRAIDIGFLRN